MFSAIRRLEEIRGKYPVFDSEGEAWLLDTGNEHVLGIGRYYRGEQLLALFNFSGEPQRFWLGDRKIYTDLISGEKGDVEIAGVGAGDFRWLLHEF